MPKPGRKPMSDRARINVQVDPAVKERLARLGGGPRRIGVAIEALLRERDSLLLRVDALEGQIEGLRDRIKGLSPTDLP